MKLSLLLLSTFVTVITAAPSEIESRIIGGGTVTDPLQSYYIAAITVKGEHACSGFIYNETWVVTAASCVYASPALNATDVTVTVGMTSQLAPNQNQKDLQVTQILTYPSYDPVTKLHDIALLKTDPITFNNYVNYKNYDEDDGQTKMVKFMGWGATTDGGLASLRLRDATLELLNTCGTHYGNTYKSNYMMCAGSPSGTIVSPCQYDEGSPIVQVQPGGVHDGVVIGIMSRNVGCNTNGNTVAPPPTVFTRLASYFSWLRTNAGAQIQPTTPPPTVPCVGCIP